MKPTRISHLLFALILFVVPFSLLIGKVWVSPDALLRHELLGVIILDLRLPRIILAIMIGGALGLSGAVMQGYLRNPLADPGLFGVSSSAALGAVLTLAFGLSSITVLLPLGALAGAGIGMVLLVLLAGHTASVIQFTLAGVVLSSLTGALTALVISLAPSPFAVAEIINWMNGALTDRGWDDVWLVLPFIITGVGVLMFTANALDALTLGESVARSLGVDMRRLQMLVVIGIGCCVGASVASAGIIGFVGLMVPHMVRPFVNNRPAAVMLPSALAGGLLLLVADMLVRIAPLASELRLGIAMSLLGAPFFLALLHRLKGAVL